MFYNYFIFYQVMDFKLRKDIITTKIINKASKYSKKEDCQTKNHLDHRHLIELVV